MKTILPINEIKVSAEFAATIPSQRKIDKYYDHYIFWGKQKKNIILDKTNTIIDGYACYLAMKKIGVTQVNVSYEKDEDRATIYVYAIHHWDVENAKEYVWRIPQNLVDLATTISVGDIIPVHNRKSIDYVKVTRIEKLSEKPIKRKIKTIVRGEKFGHKCS